MTYHGKIPETAENGIVTSDAPEGLAAIRQAHCAAAVWHRRPLTHFQSWIDRLAPEQLPRARMVVRAEAVGEAVENATRACGMTKGPERDLLVDDTSALAAIFANVMRAPYMRLRLDVIHTDACRKFHIDAVTARLICTYRGTGTQYGVFDETGPVGEVSTLPTGSPIILRGTQWPEAPISGLLHRSPPIEGSGETRLVLVLDPIFDLERDMQRHHVH